MKNIHTKREKAKRQNKLRSPFLLDGEAGSEALRMCYNAVNKFSKIFIRLYKCKDLTETKEETSWKTAVSSIYSFNDPRQP